MVLISLGNGVTVGAGSSSSKGRLSPYRHVLALQVLVAILCFSILHRSNQLLALANKHKGVQQERAKDSADASFPAEGLFEDEEEETPSGDAKTSTRAADSTASATADQDADLEYVEDILGRAMHLWNATQQPKLTWKQQEQRDQLQNEPCALLFHGLPRAFRQRVLPSIVRNLLLPNAHYACDVFVYYHYLTHEAGGRSGSGGSIDPTDVDLLERAVHRVHEVTAEGSHNHHHNSPPTVKIQHYTNADFERERGDFLVQTHTAMDPQGRPLYIPWRAGFDEDTSDNIVRMWHGIQGAWKLMANTSYSRVGFFRADVVYTTPVDLWQVPVEAYSAQRYYAAPLDVLKWPQTRTPRRVPRRVVYDMDNQVAVIPAFSPVNDRCMYGPYEALRVWATQRFAHVDSHVQQQRAGVGYGLHDEKFLKYTLFPLIYKVPVVPPLAAAAAAGVSEPKRGWMTSKSKTMQIHIDPTLCFVRARSDASLWINDCSGGGSPHVKEWIQYNLRHVEELLQTSCTTSMSKTVVQAVCNDTSASPQE